jgi:hypothetical protein
MYNGLPTSKPKKKKEEEPVGRMYKKTKAERGVKQLRKEKTKKVKPKSKSMASGKRKGKVKGRK